VMPVRSKGVTVRPIRTIDGWHHVNEVFLSDVEVPLANRIGEEGRGWDYAKFLLQHERLNSANTSPLYQFLLRTRQIVAQELSSTEHQARRQLVEMRLLRIEAEIAGQRELGLLAIDAVMNRRPLGVAPSILKSVLSRIFQQISEISFEVLGSRLACRMHEHASDAADVEGVSWIQNYLLLRARTIYGGSSEVQKNVIARELFGHS